MVGANLQDGGKLVSKVRALERRGLIVLVISYQGGIRFSWKVKERGALNIG